MADSFVFWFADPGACTCPECRDYLGVMLDSLETLSDVIAGRAAVAACLWWIERIEAGQIGFAPHPDLRRRLAAELPQGTAVVASSEYETIDIMREQGLAPVPLAFFLDPEGGFESANILPEPKLRQVDAWLEKGLEEGHTASLAYRLTPYSQYPGDYYFFRRQLNPEKSRESVLTELGEYICNPRQGEGSANEGRQFAAAVESLERWWGRRREQDLDEAASEFRTLAETRDPVRHLADAAAVLRRLARGSGNQSLEGVTEDLRLQMSTMPVFRGLTLDHLWSGRARAFLRFRIENWLQRLERQARGGR